MTATALSDDQKKECAATLKQMVGLLGLNAEVSVRDEENGLTLAVSAPEPGRLIGRKGQYLQSMELLLNRMLRKQLGRTGWIEVDVDGYQKAKRQSGRDRAGGGGSPRLHLMATDTAKEVKRWGQPRELGPFSARDRRAIHVALKDDPEVVTESESESDGSGGMKKVVIRLAPGRSPSGKA